MPKPSFEDKRKLEAKENKLQEMRTQSKMKRDVTVAVSAKGFHRTGIMCDIIQVKKGTDCMESVDGELVVVMLIYTCSVNS
jgi:hypothetical protein